MAPSIDKETHRPLKHPRVTGFVEKPVRNSESRNKGERMKEHTGKREMIGKSGVCLSPWSGLPGELSKKGRGWE